MLTPQEVSSRAFTRAPFNGYNMAMVDEFLDELTEDYTALYKENATLKAKLKVMVDKVEEYRETEDSMRATLLSAQRMGESIVKDAEARRTEMLSRAEEEARTTTEAAKRELRELEQRLTAGRAELARFIRESRDLCERELLFLNQLPQMPEAEPAEAAGAEAVPGTGTAPGTQAAPGTAEAPEPERSQAGTQSNLASVGEKVRDAFSAMEGRNGGRRADPAPDAAVKPEAVREDPAKESLTSPAAPAVENSAVEPETAPPSTEAGAAPETGTSSNTPDAQTAAEPEAASGTAETEAATGTASPAAASAPEDPAKAPADDKAASPADDAAAPVGETASPAEKSAEETESAEKKENAENKDNAETAPDSDAGKKDAPEEAAAEKAAPEKAAPEEAAPEKAARRERAGKRRKGSGRIQIEELKFNKDSREKGGKSS